MTRGLVLGVAILSAATLGVQMLETRLLSVMLWHHLTYMAMTVTLLGFAASGSLLAMAPWLGRIGGDPRVAVSLCASLFGVTLVCTFAWLAQSPLDTLDIEQDRSKYFWLFLRYAYLVVPFLCAGLAIAIALSEWKGSVHRTYFWNLLGSGAGSFLFVLAIRPLGGVGSLLFFAALGGLAGLCALAGAHGWVAAMARGLAALTLIAGLLGSVQPQWCEPWLRVEPARSKSLSMLEPFYAAVEADRRAHDPSYPARDQSLRRTLWGPLCRIDTVPVPPEPGDVQKDQRDPTRAPRSQVHLFQDGDAPTVIWSRGFAEERDHRASPYSLGYDLVERSEVLVIGPGGGNDVETALHAGARKVTAVDVNGDTLALLRGALAGYTGNLYARAEVDVVHSEGRSYLRRQGDRRFDMIVMSGTDTYVALASGSYIFSESYLYTAEAFDDLFAHLHDEGLMHVLRFRFEPPREELKLVATAAQALQRLGVPDPRAHFLVVEHEDRQAQVALAALQARAASHAPSARLADSLAAFAKHPMRYGITLIRKRPFTQDEVKEIADAIPALNHNPAVTHALVYDAGAGLAAGSEATAYGRLLGVMARGEAAAFFASYPYRIEPATDDRPFFFNFNAWTDIVNTKSGVDAGYAALTGSEPIGLYVLAALLVQTLIATLVLVVVPLFRLPRGKATSRRRAAVYFASLGVAYLLVEIATIQRFVLYLGHPTWSLTANLAIFLVFAGAGSLAAGRIGLGRRGAAFAAGIVVLLLAAHAVWLPDFLRQTLAASDAMRVLFTCAAIAPLAFCMGMPFPTGLTLLAQNAPAFLPWALGVNGAASVLSSVLAIVLAMELGFTVVFWVAAGLYAVAMLTVPRVLELAGDRATTTGTEGPATPRH